MENLIKNPGLQHIALNIFCNLDLKMLKICKQMNQFSNQLLDLENPYFWLQKFIQRGLPKKQQRDWTKAIQLTKGTVLAKYLCAYLNVPYWLVLSPKILSYYKQTKHSNIRYRWMHIYDFVIVYVWKP